jgi:hypothetical protein
MHFNSSPQIAVVTPLRLGLGGNITIKSNTVLCRDRTAKDQRKIQLGYRSNLVPEALAT